MQSNTRRDNRRNESTVVRAIPVSHDWTTTLPEEAITKLRRMKRRRKVRQVAAAGVGSLVGCVLGPIGIVVMGIGAHALVQTRGRAAELQVREQYEPSGVAIPVLTDSESENESDSEIQSEIGAEDSL